MTPKSCFSCKTWLLLHLPLAAAWLRGFRTPKTKTSGNDADTPIDLDLPRHEVSFPDWSHSDRMTLFQKKMSSISCLYRHAYARCTWMVMWHAFSGVFVWMEIILIFSEQKHSFGRRWFSSENHDVFAWTEPERMWVYCGIYPISLSDSNLCSTQINNKVKAISHQHPTHTHVSIETNLHLCTTNLPKITA